MLTELLESDAGVAVARLSSLLHVEGTDMEVVPVDVASVVKEGVYFGRCTGAVRRVRRTIHKPSLAVLFASDVESCRPVPLNGTGGRSPRSRPRPIILALLPRHPTSTE